MTLNVLQAFYPKTFSSIAKLIMIKAIFKAHQAINFIKRDLKIASSKQENELLFQNILKLKRLHLAYSKFLACKLSVFKLKK